LYYTTQTIQIIERDYWVRIIDQNGCTSYYSEVYFFKISDPLKTLTAHINLFPNKNSGSF